MKTFIKISITLSVFFSLNTLANAQSKKPSPDVILACGKIIFNNAHLVEVSQVRDALRAIKTKCKKGVLVDEKNKPLRIIQNYCPPGMPPREGDGREKAQKAIRDEIIKLKKKYRVVAYNCYPPRP